MEASPQDFEWRSLYKILIGSVLPRPIGWISTVDADGTPNLAPYSFFNVVCPNPPHLLFCPNVRSSDSAEKDTLANVRATGEFVVNIVGEATAEAMNITAQELPAGTDEFVVAGLTPAPSAAVKPPRVKESLIHFECELTQIIDISAEPGGGSVVIGRIVHFHVDDGLLVGGDKIDLSKLQPVGRLAGTSYARVTDVFDLIRPPSQVKPE